MTHHRTPHSTHRSTIGMCFVAAASIVTGFESTFAQDADRVTIDARRCIEIESPEERLACFESQVDEALAERPDGAPAAPPSTASPTPQQPVRTVELRGGQRRDDDAEADNEIVGSITSLTERQPNRQLITLDSGDVWLQKVAERYPMRVGQRVRIYASRWGASYRLQADGVNGFIQVERVH